jgi:hypothetical protein
LDENPHGISKTIILDHHNHVHKNRHPRHSTASHRHSPSTCPQGRLLYRRKIQLTHSLTHSALATRSSKRIPPAVRLKRRLAAVACCGLLFTLWLRPAASTFVLYSRPYRQPFSPVVSAPLCKELCRGYNDNIRGSAPSAGTSPTCALLEDEFTRPQGLCYNDLK